MPPPPQRPAVPYFFVDFTRDRKLLGIQPYELIVRQREYSHDAVVLHFRDQTITRRRYRKGSPVVVRWGWSPKDIETFTGYVHSSKLVSKAGEQRYLEVYCISASWRMQQPRMRTHKQSNVVAIVRRIAKEHGFTLRSDPSTRFHAAIPQLGRSDWRLLCDMAKDIGFTVHARRTELQFKRRVIDSAPGRQPTFRWYGNGLGPTRDTMYQFMHKAGSDPLVRNRRLVVGGMDDQGKPFWATTPEDCCDESDRPPFTEYWLDAMPATLQEGRRELAGLSRMNRFYVIANVVVSGVSKLRCGQTVRFVGDTLGNDVAGYWWVGAVDHRLAGGIAGRPSRYTLHMDVGRETVDHTVCVTEELPPMSWSGKPAIGDPVAGQQPEPTVFDPVEDCAPLEQAPRRCRCTSRSCPGSTRSATTSASALAPRLDRWRARAVPVKRR